MQTQKTEVAVKRPAEGKKRVSDKVLVKRLQSSNVKVAIRAGKLLAERRAVRSLLTVLKSDEESHVRRAIAVLYSIEWNGVATAQKKLSARALFPLLMKFEPTGRSIESEYAEATMIKIGGEAMPAFLALVKSRFAILRTLGFSVLRSVDWSRISPKAAFKVKEELWRIKETDKEEAFRFMAREIIRSINMVYQWCERIPETGDGKRNFGGGFV